MNSTAGLVPIRRALISTSDKTGLVPLCELLSKAGVEIVSTGNTARYLIENQVAVRSVESLTGFPEILDGRVKTLHPHVFAGILARRNLDSHMEIMATRELDYIDLVIVNLYPFEKTIASSSATRSDCLENIDIGGPSLIRAAAKNFDHVAVLCDPSQYQAFVSTFSKLHGTLQKDREAWAGAAFAHTAHYDQTISKWFNAKTLRYGENPHQKARVVVDPGASVPLAGSTPLQGKELSYNNLLDSHAAIYALRCLMLGNNGHHAGCVIIKHTTPCGAAKRKEATAAVATAFACDPVSAFGGIVALSDHVDASVAEVLKPHFIELIIAPDFSPEALAILGLKKDLRLLAIPSLLSGEWPSESVRSIFGGTLIQDFDVPTISNALGEVVTQAVPSTKEYADLEIANHLAITCVSNAITIVRDAQLIGVGAGQTSRIDSVRLAIQKAREYGHSLQGASLGSDGFFPFADSLVAAKEAGITAVIQPGGSKRDSEVIAKANDLGLAMLFSHARHFRH